MWIVQFDLAFGTWLVFGANYILIKYVVEKDTTIYKNDMILVIMVMTLVTVIILTALKNITFFPNSPVIIQEVVKIISLIITLSMIVFGEVKKEVLYLSEVLSIGEYIQYKPLLVSSEFKNNMPEGSPFTFTKMNNESKDNISVFSVN